MKRYGRTSPAQRSMMLLGYSFMGLAVSLVGLVLVLLGKSSGAASTAMFMTMVVGGSLCTVGITQFFLVDDSGSKRLSLWTAVIAGLGALLLLVTLFIWLW